MADEGPYSDGNTFVENLGGKDLLSRDTVESESEKTGESEIYSESDYYADQINDEQRRVSALAAAQNVAGAKNSVGVLLVTADTIAQYLKDGTLPGALQAGEAATEAPNAPSLDDHPTGAV